ncbi:MAG: hypothetical protein JXA92_03915 [candidate division Zixibacteria bacterium]|nr:hypothetical protein [candidate division Zixibacteria bacterium]
MSIRKFNIRPKALTLLLLLVVLFITAAPTVSHAEEMTMSPFKIILNAKGQFEDMQAVIRMPLEAGYTLSDYQVSLAFNGTMVGEAISFRYCYIDDNFLAGFDRAAVLANPVVIGLANTTTTATVEGWFEGVNSEGGTYTQYFSCTDMVEIIDPGQK